MALFSVILKTSHDRDWGHSSCGSLAVPGCELSFLSVAQTLHFSLFVSQEKHVFLVFRDQINAALLIKRFQTHRISVRLRTAAGRENWKIRVLLIVGYVYVCVHGIARWGVIFIPGYVKLKASLNICVEFWANWEWLDIQPPHLLSILRWLALLNVCILPSYESTPVNCEFCLLLNLTNEDFTCGLALVTRLIFFFLNFNSKVQSIFFRLLQD